jgi:hypothetical protein
MLLCRCSNEGRITNKHFVHCDSKGPHIALCYKSLPVDYFRGHVVRSSHEYNRIYFYFVLFVCITTILDLDLRFKPLYDCTFVVLATWLIKIYCEAEVNYPQVAASTILFRFKC